MGKEDAELVRVALQGRGPEAERAFEGLVSRWKDRLYRFVLARVRRSHDAEEIAAEAFVRAWKSLATLRNPEHFRSWLFRIAWNQVRSHYEARGMKRELTLPDQDWLEAVAMDSPLEFQADLQHLLAQIPPPSLRILHFKYEALMSYEEIAAQEGVAVSTVRDRLMEARQQLERTLARTDYLDFLGKRAEEKRRRRALNGNGGGAPSGPSPTDGPDAGAGSRAPEEGESGGAGPSGARPTAPPPDGGPAAPGGSETHG